ncbi:hypothetical protein [Serratia sp. CY76391]|uniref:hypothetical protein n=1 Tax=Serratia sp. CY76391 TaxID=3383681 RepID=UPI003F9FE009
MKVCLGVVDLPYVEDGGTTTHEVAEFLEDRYNLFTWFWTLHKDTIVNEVGEHLAFAIVNHIQHGVPMVGNEMLGETMRTFNIFLEQEEMAGLPGVPTGAAIRRENARLKSGKGKGERRPSFIDTGIFKASFIAWIDENAES